MWFSRAVGLRLLAGVSTAALMATALVPVAPAATLDEQTCDQLKLEIGELEKIGARDNLAKGAAWGRANLRSAQLEQVKKLIEMDEAVAFRCPRPKPQPDPATVAAAAKGKASAKGAPKGKSAESGKSAQEKVLAKPKPRPKTQPQATADGSPDAAAAAAKPRPKAPAPKPAAAKPAPDALVTQPKAPPQ